MLEPISKGAVYKQQFEILWTFRPG